MPEKAEDKQNQEYEETDLGDAGSRKGNHPEAEQSGEDRYHQEYQRPVKHLNLLPVDSHSQCAMAFALPRPT
jgi:hypothetical protein